MANLKDKTGTAIPLKKVPFLRNYFKFCMLTGISGFEHGVVGFEMTMKCPIKTPNDSKIAEWSWYKHDGSTKQQVSVMEANDSAMDPNVTSLNQSEREIRSTFQVGALTLRSLQLNDSGVYECQLNTGTYTELRYIKLTVNGKFLMRTINNKTQFTLKISQ